MKSNINSNNAQRRRRLRRNRVIRRRMRGNRRRVMRNRVVTNRLNYMSRKTNSIKNNVNNKNKINVNNNINNKINKTNTKIDKLADDLSKLSLSLFPKTTNIYRKLKEPRVDKYITPMDMGLSHRFTSLFRTGNRIRYVSLYNRFEVDNSTIPGFIAKYLWFPYSVNFQSYPDLSITVSDLQEGSRPPNIIAPLIRVTTNNVGPQIEGMTVYNCASCGLVGNYRLVGATLKITNLSAFNIKAGSYIIYKLNENTAYPPFYAQALVPAKPNSPKYTEIVGTLANLNHDQVMLKQSFSASDVGYIHEYNIYEGNNIFQTPNEYIGADYTSGEEPVATWSGNPQGNNIKYEIDIPTTTTLQSYLIETWQILEIVPNPSLNLDNTTDFQTHVFNEDVLDEIRRKMPIVKG